MATQFIPYSVVMRGMGYVRVPRTQKWVPEEVMERMAFRAEVAKAGAPIRKMMRTDPICQALENGVSWGELAQVAQDQADARFLAMTDDEWRHYLWTDKSKSWEECQRIAGRRRVAKATAPVAEPKTCAYWYNEYTRYPHLYFSSPAEQAEAIAEVIADWRVSVGRWRLGAMEAAAQKIQQAWREFRRNRETFEAPCFCNDCMPMCEACNTANPMEDTLADVPLCAACVFELEVTDTTFYCHGCGVVSDRSKAVCHLQWSTPGHIVCETCGAEDRELYANKKRHHCGDWMCPGDCGVLRCGCIDMCRCYRDRDR